MLCLGTILSLLLTNGLSQDNNSVTLPEEQVKALLKDAQLYQVCVEELAVRDSLIKTLKYNSMLKDSMIVQLTNKVEACEETLDQNKPSEWNKYLYSVGGIILTMIINKGLD